MTKAAHYEPISPLPEEIVRRSVMVGVCPFCERGPFQVVARHVHDAHGISAAELREMAGLIKRTPMTSPEYHSSKSELAKRQYREGKTLLGRPDPKNRSISRAALKIIQQRFSDPDSALREAWETARRANLRRGDQTRYEILSTYHGIVEETGTRHGAMAETSRRLGISESAVSNHINGAMAGIRGNHGHVTLRRSG